MCTRFVASTVLAFGIAGIANANLLVNPGFEINSLTTPVNVLGNFTGFQGIWAPENGTITGVNGGVTPASGIRMLKVDDDGSSYSQTFQVTDVSAYSVGINAGLATASLGALFTTGPNLTGALAVVGLSFFSTSTYGSLISSGTSTLVLDGSATTWQSLSMSMAIPVGTTWIMSQVAYKNSTLYSSNGVGYSGYVDDADLDIKVIPAPGAFALLSLGGIVAGRRRRVG